MEPIEAAVSLGAAVSRGRARGRPLPVGGVRGRVEEGILRLVASLAGGGARTLIFVVVDGAAVWRMGFV